MEQLFESIDLSLRSRNWQAGLAIALMLPDVCSGALGGEEKSDKKYIDWYDKYVLPTYTYEVGPEHEKHIFLSGRDCYALRCAFLHAGTDDISGQRISEALSGFIFIAPRAGISVHCNQFDDKLQLEVDKFCWDFLAAGKFWWGGLSSIDQKIVNEKMLLIQ